jgi:hypothetical protein
MGQERGEKRDAEARFQPIFSQSDMLQSSPAHRVFEKAG